jgi:type I restriction enzyme S subunit
LVKTDENPISFNVYTFNGLTGKTKDDFGIGKSYIQYMQVFSNSKIDTANFGLVAVKSDDKQNKVKYGDVFFTTSSETLNEIGFSSVLTKKVKDVYLNSFCFGYCVNQYNLFIIIDNLFCYFCMIHLFLLV